MATLRKHREQPNSCESGYDQEPKPIFPVLPLPSPIAPKSRRARIVEGAVSMVEMALQHLKEGQIIEMDDKQKAAMVSNLMVVLCSESETNPVINAGHSG